MRDSMVFYRSFYESVKDLPPEQYKETLNALFAYAMDDQLTELPVVPNALFTAFKPQIDANNRKYENGCKGGQYGYLGGRPKKPQENPNKTPNKPPMINENENVNVNDKYKRKKNSFCNGVQRDYDFEELERKVFKK